MISQDLLANISFRLLLLFSSPLFTVLNYDFILFFFPRRLHKQSSVWTSSTLFFSNGNGNGPAHAPKPAFCPVGAGEEAKTLLLRWHREAVRPCARCPFQTEESSSCYTLVHNFEPPPFQNQRQPPCFLGRDGKVPTVAASDTKVFGRLIRNSKLRVSLGAFVRAFRLRGAAIYVTALAPTFQNKCTSAELIKYYISIKTQQATPNNYDLLRSMGSAPSAAGNSNERHEEAFCM